MKNNHINQKKLTCPHCDSIIEDEIIKTDPIMNCPECFENFSWEENDCGFSSSTETNQRHVHISVTKKDIKNEIIDYIHSQYGKFLSKSSDAYGNIIAKQYYQGVLDGLQIIENFANRC